jgi:hypothetical protein
MNVKNNQGYGHDSPENPETSYFSVCIDNNHRLYTDVEMVISIDDVA